MAKLLITGATDGIGLAAAEMLAKAGHDLILHGRSTAKLESTVTAISALGGGGDVTGVLADFADLPDVARMAEQLLEAHEAIDVLINNAGVFRMSEPVLPSRHDARFIVNTLASMLLTKRLLPIISKRGRVVSLSSAAQSSVDLALLKGETRAKDEFNVYGQSKLALTMWSQQIAAQHSQGPDFIAVNPGSMLASKMVREGFGMAGNDISIGANILVDCALSPDFADKSGRFFDNDAGRWGIPHRDAQDDAICAKVVEACEAEIAQLLSA